jgi:ATP-dependent Clp protease ATP-binding subunit ClpB
MSDAKATHDYLERGHDLLARYPHFRLVCREKELGRLTEALTRKNANSVLLVGPGGVGCSALCIGLQASKDDPDVSYDVISKRFYWLDTDGLFESGDPDRINQSFQKALKTLSRYGDSVMIIDDMRDFVDGMRNTGCSNLINALMRGVRQNKFQAILEADDEDLEVVLKCHSNMREDYTLLDVNQPVGEALLEIVQQAAEGLHNHHKIAISQDAIDTVIELTDKYRVRDLGLSRAQPSRAVTLLDRALTSYRLNAHARDPRLAELEAKLQAEANTKAKASLQKEIDDIAAKWYERQQQLRGIYKDLRKAEENILELEDELNLQLKAEQESRERLLSATDVTEDEVADKQARLAALSQDLEHGNFGSKAVNALRERIGKYQELAGSRKKEFEGLIAEVNDRLELQREHVLAEFSAISGVPVSKLTQDERAKLQNLEAKLGNRVFGQEEAVRKLCDEVLIAKAGLQDPNRPQGSFLFLGPSGVGKTELAKGLAAELFDDPGALLRFDMSEYQEKHALAKLIGAPPGYEGYEAGGILTNEMRRNPRRIVLFDEIEKAHPDIFLIFLQILDEARLTDNRGLTVSFRDSIILMTSNTGKQHFIAETDFDIAKAKAIDELESNLPPELLNRFNGRQNIVCFNKLGLPVIERIALRDLSKLNALVKANRPGLDLTIDDDDVKAMCREHYEPIHGARGITGYIQSGIKPAIAKTLLFDESAAGTIRIEYDHERRSVNIDPPASLETAAAK